MPARPHSLGTIVSKGPHSSPAMPTSRLSTSGPERSTSRLRGLRRGLTISALTLVLCLFAAELLLRGLGYANKPAVYYDPAIGIRYFPNQSRRMLRNGQDLGGFETNDRGFRGPSFEVEREEGVRRIVCLGDSFTLGWGVPGVAAWPQQLQRHYDEAEGPGAVEVINLGLPDYCTVNELRLYREIARKLEPDLVVLGYVENDLMPETLGPVSKFAKFEYVIGSSATVGALRTHMFKQAGVYQYGDTTINHRKRRRYRANRRLIQERPEDPISSGYWRLSMLALEQLAAESHADGAELLVAVFPRRAQVQQLRMHFTGKEPLSETELRDRTRYQARIRTSVTRSGARFLDLLPAYARSKFPVYHSIDDFHPSVMGQKIAADEVFAQLLELQAAAPVSASAGYSGWIDSPPDERSSTR